MKTVLALLFALLIATPIIAVPVNADAAQDNRRQERASQNAQRGGNARAQRQQARPQRQVQRQQARPQRQARQQQQQVRQQGVAPRQNRRQQANGNNGQFRRDGGAQGANRFSQNRQGPNRAAPNRLAPNRFNQNRQGRNGTAPNRQGRNRVAQNQRNNRQYAGRFGGNRNDIYNGRQGRNRYAGQNRNYNRGYGGAGRFYYRGNYRSALRVRPYRYPRGYNYTTWRIGAFLPSLFLSAQYYYDDYYQLGLTPPPRGYRWVRYGTDVLLVNLYSGEVVDVVYGAFYW